MNWLQESPNTYRGGGGEESLDFVVDDAFELEVRRAASDFVFTNWTAGRRPSCEIECTGDSFDVKAVELVIVSPGFVASEKWICDCMVEGTGPGR